MRSTLARISRFRRNASHNSRSGAITWFLWRKRNTRNTIASTLPNSPATAALWMPICGKPAQPRISAGVSSKPTAVETISASNGDTVSLTPRSNWVNRINTSSNGMISIITRA